MFHRIKFFLLKEKIKKNPHLGKEDVDGSNLYTQGIYAIRYCIIKDTGGRESVEWISKKRRLSPYEEKTRRLKRSFSNFWHYQGWLFFFRPPVLFLLVASIILFYFGLIETETTKIERYKWVVSRALGVRNEDIEYIGDGWIGVPVERKTIVESQEEQAKYVFSPFRWLSSSEGGIFIRRGIWPYQYSVTHPVVYNSKGEVWLKKEGEWIHGKIYSKGLKWDTPQRVIGRVEVTGHEISTHDKKIQIIDK